MATVNLAKIYRIGEDVEQIFELAFKYFKKATELGHEIGMIETYLAYKTGEGVKKDISKAKFWYEKIKDRLPIIANDLYEIGLNNAFSAKFSGNDEYFKNAFRYMQDALRYGKDFLVYIAQHYLYGWGVKQNINKAMEYFIKKVSELKKIPN